MPLPVALAGMMICTPIWLPSASRIGRRTGGGVDSVVFAPRPASMLPWVANSRMSPPCAVMTLPWLMLKSPDTTLRIAPPALVSTPTVLSARGVVKPTTMLPPGAHRSMSLPP